jgi:hypothetical protein
MEDRFQSSSVTIRITRSSMSPPSFAPIPPNQRMLEVNVADRAASQAQKKVFDAYDR